MFTNKNNLPGYMQEDHSKRQKTSLENPTIEEIERMKNDPLEWVEKYAQDLPVYKNNPESCLNKKLQDLLSKPIDPPIIPKSTDR